jgi:transposase
MFALKQTSISSASEFVFPFSSSCQKVNIGEHSLPKKSGKLARFLAPRIWKKGNKIKKKQIRSQPGKRKGINPLKPELNPICYLLALLGAHHFLHVSRIRVKLLTFRLLLSYIYGAPILDVSRSHTTTQHSR